LGHCVQVREHVVEFVIETGDEVGEDQDLGRVLEVLLQIGPEVLIADVTGNLTILGQVLVGNKSVSVDTLSLVHPEFD
jgi:hypothetical protein